MTSATIVTLSRRSRMRTICHGTAALDGDGTVEGGDVDADRTCVLSDRGTARSYRHFVTDLSRLTRRGTCTQTGRPRQRDVCTSVRRKLRLRRHA